MKLRALAALSAVLWAPPLAAQDAPPALDLSAAEVETSSVVTAGRSERIALGSPAGLPGLSSHFKTWLDANGYASWDFNRADVAGGSYGGRTSASEPVVNQPVIFIHGNSDSALGTGSVFTGFSTVIPEFLARGYRPSELYATTWGPANALLSSQQYHSKANLTRLRAFVEAVLAYTGATKGDIVAHSMGVTLMRKVVKGGTGNDAAAGGSYNLGAALTSKVDTFVGIAGANWGLVSCYQAGPTTPTCGSTNGEYPGYWYGPTGLSTFLSGLNATSGYEGAYRFTIWSTADEVIGYGDLVWGRYTSPIPGQTGEKRFGSAPYGHFNSKDLTAVNQWRMVSAHVVD